VIAGPFRDGAGALIVYEAESQRDAEALAANDPYCKSGVCCVRPIRAMPGARVPPTGDASRLGRLGKRRLRLVSVESARFKFREVSNIDQQLRKSGEHAARITAPPSAIIGDRECRAPA
jgi:hypothetical protein